MSIMTSLKRLAVGTALAAMVAIGTVPAATAADGDPVVPAVTQNKGSLTVHKHEQGAADKEHDGRQLTPPPSNRAIKGVEFTVRKVRNFDLKTNKGWKDAAAVIAAYNGGATNFQSADLGPEKKATTNDQGVANFNDLELGLYLVTESNVANATIDGARVTPVPSKPFLVTIPMTNQNDHKSWLYDVHVYPKNSLVNVSKTVNDENKNVGDKLEYTILTAIPAVAEGKTLDKYVIIDPLPSALTYALGTDKKQVSLVDGATAITTPSIAEDADYNVTYDSAKKILKVVFTDAGRAKLVQAKKAHPNAQVKFLFDATLGALPQDSDNGLKNTVYLVPSNEFSETPEVPNGGVPPITPYPPTEPPTGTVPPTNPDGNKPPTWPNGNVPPNDNVTSKFGKIKFKKADGAGDSAKALAGAKFKLALCSAGDAKPTNNDQFITVSGNNEWVSDAKGEFQIDGLHASDWKNGQADHTFNDTNKQYCLWEIEAPAGYELMTEPIKFNISGGQKDVQTYGSNIINYPANGGFNLPLTGSNSLIMLSIAGGLLVVGGGIAVLRNRKAQR